MGTVTNLQQAAANRRRASANGDAPSRTAGNGRYVQCEHCSERHPIIKLANGTERCFTAFADGDRWFCQNRGCRAAYLGRT